SCICALGGSSPIYDASRQDSVRRPEPRRLPRAMTATRRLAAILASDMAGYSRLMGQDEEGTHERLKAHFGQLVEPKIGEHRGRVVKNTGDGYVEGKNLVIETFSAGGHFERLSDVARQAVSGNPGCDRRRREPSGRTEVGDRHHPFRWLHGRPSRHRG